MSTPPRPPHVRDDSREPLLTLTGVRRSYTRGAAEVHALRGVDLTVWPGELLALVGASGSGKSTLLFLLAGWEAPDGGSIAVGSSLSAPAPGRLPWRELAVVPQSLGMVDELTIGENVTLPIRLSGVDRQEDGMEERGEEVLARLDIEHLAERRPGEASLGEQQRAALARALLLEPRIVLVDEPTTHQDHKRADRVFEELHHAAAAGTAVVVATHDATILDHADRVLRLHDGQGTMTDPAQAT